MKKIIIMSLVALTAVSCADFGELNTDPKNPSEVPAGALFANAEKDLFDFMTSCSVNVNNFRLWAQQWAQTTYADESNYQLVERNVNGAAWNTLYAEVLRDLNEAKEAIEANGNLSDAQRNSQLAMAEVLQIFTYHVLVDIFGDIPYTEALTATATPAYDDDQAIYADLAARLDAAIADLSGDSGTGSYDLVYGGDADMWRLFANSLKLRMAIRMGNQSMAEAAVADGVFADNSENFALVYQSATPNTNPVWVSLVQSGRSDYVAASTIVDPMKAVNDPRLDYYFQDQISGEYLGGSYGDNNNYNAFSHPGAMQQDPTLPGTIMGASEVYFLIADAATRGWNVGMTAAAAYDAGITASITQWGGSAAEVSAYLANADVAFATAPGTDTEKIAMQKWIALYDQGFEAWCSYRMYDYPDLPIAVQAQIPTPRRYTYPVTEYSLNEDNVDAAGAAIGGDALDSRVFWDN